MADWFEGLKWVVTVAVGWAAVNVARSQRDVASSQAKTASLQRRTADAKLSLDLFDQRYPVFEKVWEFLSDSTRTEGTLTNHSELSNLIPKAEFLFGKPIADYMRDMHDKRVKLDTAHRRVKANTSSTEEDEKAIADLEHWFHEEASNCFKRFADYLDFTRWKVDALERLLS